MTRLNLVYMAKPTYGGWVSFTTHMALKYDLELLVYVENNEHNKKVGKRTEKDRLRNYGYGLKYQNMAIEDITQKDNLLITAIDKTYYKYLDMFPYGTKIVIHDPTEVKAKSSKALIDNLPRFEIFTIRKTVQKYLKDNFNLDSQFMEHPFYEYPVTKTPFSKKNRIVATSRIDFDKHTDIILKANQLLSKNNQIEVYGAKNGLYVYHNLTNKLDLKDILDKSYKGTFTKSFNDLDSILHNSKIMVDLSAIKNDGGGSQYTFLEAIYQGCVLVLNNKWIDGINTTPFVDGYNCIVVKNEEDLKQVITSTKYNLNEISDNARELLEPHVYIAWSNVIH